MTTVDKLVPVTLIYDPTQSPPDTQPLGGQVILTPPEHIPLPATGSFYGQPGYSRQQAGAWEWVMSAASATGGQLDVFVDSLTGRPGWVNPDSRATMKTAAQRLLKEGLPKALIQQMLPAVYSAVKTEVVAEQMAPPPT
jgi:hypothetical protein